MQKWDMLLIDSHDGRVELYSTNPDELTAFGDVAVKEARSYFSYAANTNKKFEIFINQRSNKGHEIQILYAPRTDYLSASETEILDTDFRYFLLNIAIARGWLPYPGDGECRRFIRYNE